MGSLPAEKLEKFLQGRPQRFVVAPGGEGLEGVGTTIAEGLNASQEESGVAGDEEGGGAGYGLRVPDLGLADAQTGLLLAEVDLDFPTAQITVDEEGDRNLEVGGD